MTDNLSIAARYSMLSAADQARLKELHRAASFVNTLIDKHIRDAANSKEVIQEYNNLLQTLEFAMQRIWGFPEDANYHTWWLDAEECLCPKMDNKDPLYWGRGKIISGDCPIHGKAMEEKHD